MAEVKELIQKYLPQVLEHRRHIHAHPELRWWACGRTSTPCP